MTFTFHFHIPDGGGLVAHSCLILRDPMDCSPPGSSVHGISQARVLAWVAIAFSRESYRPRNQTQVSHIDRQMLYCLSLQGKLHGSKLLKYLLIYVWLSMSISLLLHFSEIFWKKMIRTCALKKKQNLMKLLDYLCKTIIH